MDIVWLIIEFLQTILAQINVITVRSRVVKLRGTHNSLCASRCRIVRTINNMFENRIDGVFFF